MIILNFSLQGIECCVALWYSLKKAQQMNGGYYERQKH